MPAELEVVRAELVADPANAWARERGYEPVYAAAAGSRILLIGQAPGRKAQDSGVPFDDASGVRLREWLGVTDEQFYDPMRFAILPMDFYFPGQGSSGDLPPRKDFAPRWHPRLLAAMPDVALTLLVGGYAQKHYLETHRNLTETVRAYREYLPSKLPLVHPSPLNFRWHKKNPWFETEVVPVLRARVREVLG
ncbi:uracil-DNA glycosylase family protein [Amycolatopsis sp. PS_44_ISF1]|uniref:uracil-DNA glycosylase family protein n=1 Tax=Amycolatopsis sp. PS_44_ISF1 TaxID=2974917 RepID=UPI0028E0518F|nr:uracil-DNA glycosylase family protein [Amycolatopsis sp. PS_44_ISF1]MDT8913439.1 uracil-DNA glycosylase family protein [Amycolatopsis sp. PS_44_ISF1]